MADMEEIAEGEGIASEGPDMSEILNKAGQRWALEIERAQKVFQPWHSRCEKIEKIYIEERAESGGKRHFPILWANMSVLEPAVYARPPQAAVERRNKDDEPIARQASLIYERALNYLRDADDMDYMFRQVRSDFLLTARGQAWVRYEADFDAQEQEGAEEPVETISDERVCVDYVHWSDFLHDPARKWKDVNWIARRVHMTRDAIEDRFGKDALQFIPTRKDGGNTLAVTSDDKDATSAIWEIWDKTERLCIWLPEGGTRALEAGDPPLRFDGFFPCPRPAYGTLSHSTLIPVPDYVYYQGQATEIDELTNRIADLTDQLRLVGFYPAGDGDVSSAVEKAMKPSTGNAMIPIPSWSSFTDKGGANGSVVWLPIDQVLKVIQGCVAARKELIDDVYQITGISDIVRGESDPNETATAQRVKSQWGSIRIRDRQAEMARFCRDVFRLMAEVISEQFQPQTLLAMSQVKALPMQVKEQYAQLQAGFQQAQAARQANPQAAMAPPLQPPPPPPEGMDEPSIEELMALIKNDELRNFAIDVETDSTIEPDEDAEKQRRIEFVTAVGGFVEKAIPVIEKAPMLTNAVGEMLLFVARGFRAGRQLETVLEQNIKALAEQANQPKPPPQPSPDEQVKLQSTMVKANAEQQKAKIGLVQAQVDHAQAMQKAQHDAGMMAMQNAQQAAQAQMQPQGIPQ